MSGEKCETCHYYYERENTCRRNPPVVATVVLVENKSTGTIEVKSLISAQPQCVAGRDGWCGSWWTPKLRLNH